MRTTAFALTCLTVLGASGANAFDCDISVTPSPDGTAYTVIFDGIEGFFAEVGSAAQCDISVPIDQLPDGVFAVFSADFRGFLNEGAVGQMLVLNGGQLVGVIVSAEGGDIDGLFFSGFAGSNGTGDAIVSSIDLEVLDFDDPGSIFDLDTIDYLELARATADALQASADQLAAARTGVVTHLNGTFDLLLGATRPLAYDDRAGLIGGIGSVTLGVNGQMSLLDGFSLHGGAAFVDQSSVGANTTGGLFAGAVRYLAPGDDLIRPFAEGGLKAAPALNLAFSRSYETSVGTTTATGSTTGAFFGAFIRGGALVAPDTNNDILFTATLAQDWLSTAGYDETLDGSNLFAASVPEQTGTFTTVKAGVDWTTRPMPALDLTFSGALGLTHAHDEVETGIAFAGTFLSAGVSEGFVEYGARAGYQVTEAVNIGAFVHGVTGAVSGTHVQIGGDAHVSF
jgi:hypothetical protein